MAVSHVPEGYSSVTPYLIVDGASRAIDYYKDVFGATELMRFDGPDGKILHAELQIGDARIMIADEQPDKGHRSPRSLGGSGTGFMVYVEDVDRVFMRAIDVGGNVKEAVKDQFYGDRSGTFTDPFGHIWTIATHVEDVSPEEMQRRAEAAAAQTTP